MLPGKVNQFNNWFKWINKVLSGKVSGKGSTNMPNKHGHKMPGQHVKVPRKVPGRVPESIPKIDE